VSFLPEREILLGIFNRMLEAYGPQHWWPADSAFEVVVGSLLTQNTAWPNVEKAIVNLKGEGALSAERIVSLPRVTLAELIRPSGYFNVKAERLVSLCDFVLAEGGLEALARLDTAELRRRVLAVKGVGPETADDIVLYAFGRPVFVIDAYTRRIFERLGLAQGGEGYEELRHGFEQALGPDPGLFNEYHALVVRHAKVSCRKRPECAPCILADRCAIPTAVG